jgi:NAD(P)-dependent dehydrogenase (short-subunit alcohol dehydrogenase family)
MDSFAGKLAVVTGGGSGMGRELVRQLAAQGCSVAACDIHGDAVMATAAVAQDEAQPGVLVTGHTCDVCDEAQVLRFRDEVQERHDRGHVNLVFSNAGIGGGGSFVNDSREEWERTFGTDWCGVYYCARAFVPLLVNSDEGVLVNTSSVNGLWSPPDPGQPQTAYAAAKFAVRGFTEALIEDLRTNAPHVKVALVLPGHVGTDIIVNTLRAHGHPTAQTMSQAELDEARAKMIEAEMDVAGQSDSELRQTIADLTNQFKEKAPVSAVQAATIILDAVRSGSWRILIGKDAKWLDERVRADPEGAYDYAEFFKTAEADLAAPADEPQTPAEEPQTPAEEPRVPAAS